MFKKFGVSLSVLGLMASGLMIPQAQASSLSDAIQASVREDYSFESTVSVMADNRQELSEWPFDLDLFGRVEGVKNGFDVWSKATMNMTMDDFNTADLSESMSNLSKIWMGVDVEGTYFDKTQTSYFSMSNVQANSDNAEVNDILGMIQESVKVFANNHYRYSVSELVESLEAAFGSDMPSGEIENLVSVLNQSSMKLENLLPMLTEDFTDLLESGLFDVQAPDSNGIAFRSFGSGKEYTITLADKVTAAEAKRATKALANLMTKLFPTMKDEIMWELEATSGSDAANIINEFLMAANNVEASIVITVENGLVTKSSTNINLGALRIPVRIVAEERLRYGTQPAIVAPGDEDSIVNINKIVQGFMTIGKMAQDQFMSSYEMVEPVAEWENEWDETPEWDVTPEWAEKTLWEPVTDWEGADPGMADFMMLNARSNLDIMINDQYKRIIGGCHHMRCAEAEIRRFRRKLREFHSSNELDYIENTLREKVRKFLFYWEK